MLFNSYVFVGFFFFVYSLYLILRLHHRALILTCINDYLDDSSRRCTFWLAR